MFDTENDTMGLFLRIQKYVFDNSMSHGKINTIKKM